MKKYKHKQTGDIAELVNTSGYKLNKSTIGLIPIQYIENSSDWEEIKEKQWEIMSFIVTENINLIPKGTIATRCLKDSNIFKNKKVFLVSEQSKYLEHPYWKIHSVKRLSDSKLFTLGDRIKGDLGVSEITKFELDDASDSGMIVYAKDYIFGTKSCSYTTACLSYIKLDESLFKTEDGKDIYEGDVYYFLVDNVDFEIVENKARKNSHYENDGTERFSTKKAAENYIICNKPCLSFNDVWNMTINKSSDNNYVVIAKKDLKELVKSKIF